MTFETDYPGGLSETVKELPEWIKKVSFVL